MRGSKIGDKWDAFAAHLHYCRGEYDAPETYEELGQLLADLDGEYDTVGNRLFYLATPPQLYLGVVEQLGKAGLDTGPRLRPHHRRETVRP